MNSEKTDWASVLGQTARKPFFWGIVAIVVLLGINLVKDPSFLAISYNANTGYLSGNVLDILRAAAPIMLIAVGMTLVVATAGIDLSVGSVMVASGAVAMQFLAGVNTPGSAGAALGAVLLALAVGAAMGLLSGVLVAYVGLQPFITTLVMMMAGRGLAKVITGGNNTKASNDAFSWIANGRVLGFPVVFVIAVVVVVLVALVIRWTALGMMIEAIGINANAARMAGIKPRGLLVTVYTVSGLLAAGAGMMSVASVMTVDVSQTGNGLEMDAILALVVGGTSLAGGKFHIGGSVVGALMITTLDKTVKFLGIASSATPAFKAAVIIILCLLQSERVRNLLLRRRRDKSTVAAPIAVATPKESVTA
ncbi:ABC transporter permease [Brooklawnia cerclae]|uniref:Simple sugar transport system permease protein n=1 Tax=Brooklawnia cerclae TaxID=349934 RepID=A0ABX0SFH7_9ACTN|nr:ABC transporter permease [Brooklawnia cerclae]NIH57153.1 simple sugar transport system permease protein [Brooklawnia cerclae]